MSRFDDGRTAARYADGEPQSIYSVARSLASFEHDPPSDAFQRGFLCGLKEIMAELLIVEGFARGKSMGRLMTRGEDA